MWTPPRRWWRRATVTSRMPGLRSTSPGNRPSSRSAFLASTMVRSPSRARVEPRQIGFAGRRRCCPCRSLPAHPTIIVRRSSFGLISSRSARISAFCSPRLARAGRRPAAWADSPLARARSIILPWPCRRGRCHAAPRSSVGRNICPIGLILTCRHAGARTGQQRSRSSVASLSTIVSRSFIRGFATRGGVGGEIRVGGKFRHRPRRKLAELPGHCLPPG